MAVKVSNVADPTLIFEFTCTEWALMSDATKADWNVTENSCGVFSGFGSPYAASDIINTLGGFIGVDDPIILTLIDGIYTIGINPATGTMQGSMSANDYLKAQSYLEPVSLNTITTAIPVGAVTSIDVGAALLEKEYVIGDVFSVIDNATGVRVKLTVTADTAALDTSIAVSGTAADAIPIGGILVPIFSVRQTLSAGTGISIVGGVITNTAPDQTVVLNNGAGISVTGTYPNFTIASTVTQYTDELAQDAIGGALTDSQTINFTYNDGANTITADVITQMSITSDASGLKLSGDSASPGNNKLYGTDAGGVKGWYTQPGGGGGLIDGDYGDITVSGTGTVMTIDQNVVTFAKIQQIGTNKLLGRDTPAAGNVEEISLNATLEFDGSLNLRRAALTGDVTAAAGSNATTIPNDTVTNAKLANMNAATLKGNNLGVAADPQDLTKAQIQTLMQFLDGTLTATRIPYAQDADTLIDTANHVWLNATQENLIGGGTSRDARFSHNVTGTISGNSTLIHGENNVSGDYWGIIKNTRNVSNTGRAFFVVEVGGTAAGDAFFVTRIASGAQFSFGIDNSDADKWKLTPLSTAPGSVANSGLIVTSEAVAKVGINKDAPSFPLDVSGINRSDQFIGGNVGWVSGDISFGLGAGTAPTFTGMKGTHNFVRVAFKTGTSPTANNVIFTLVFKGGFGYAAKAFPLLSAGNANAASDITKFYCGDNTGLQFNVVANGTLSASTDYVLYIAFSGY